MNSLEETRVEGPEDDEMAAPVSRVRGDERMLRTHPDRPHARLSTAIGNVEMADEVWEAVMGSIYDGGVG